MTLPKCKDCEKEIEAGEKFFVISGIKYKLKDGKKWYDSERKIFIKDLCFKCNQEWKSYYESYSEEIKIYIDEYIPGTKIE